MRAGEVVKRLLEVMPNLPKHVARNEDSPLEQVMAILISALVDEAMLAPDQACSVAEQL
jgi:hypothetical protein